MKNPLLVKAEAAISAKVKPADKQAYTKILLAGMKVMFSKETHQMLIKGVEDAPDKVDMIVKSVIGILGILYKQSRGTMPIGAMVLAGNAMLMEALDFAEQSGMVTIDAPTLGTATQAYIEHIMGELEKKNPGIGTLMDKAQMAMQDPQKMAQYQQQQGA